MKLQTLAAIGLISPLLVGCTMTLPMSGQFQTTSESFAGHATGHIDGAGEIAITLAAGVKCTGRFVYVTGRQGSGTLTCSDGRSGKFDFVSTGSRGTGSGTLNGAPFNFTFG